VLLRNFDEEEVDIFEDARHKLDQRIACTATAKLTDRMCVGV